MPPIVMALGSVNFSSSSGFLKLAVRTKAALGVYLKAFSAYILDDAFRA